MYRIEWTPAPWQYVLRCTETGAAYPNGGPDKTTGETFPHFESAEKARRYAERHGIPLVSEQ